MTDKQKEHERLYLWHERIAIKMDSGIPEREAEKQATEEQEAQLNLALSKMRDSGLMSSKSAI